MQEDNKALQVAMDPNIYATSLANINYDEEKVYVMFVSGNQGRRFQFSPKHAKRLFLLLQKQLEEFQRKFGNLDTALPTKIDIATSAQSIGFTEK